jgi:hypothetical protein
MPAPFTIVYLKDTDGDEFPVRLPGVHPSHLDGDVQAAMDILHEQRSKDLQKPNGELTFDRIEYV